MVILDHHRQSSESIETLFYLTLNPMLPRPARWWLRFSQYITDGVKLRPIEADAMFAWADD